MVQHADIDHTGVPGVTGSDGFKPHYDPDRPPSSYNAASDEFDDDALNGAWTWTTAPSGAVSESAFTGYLHLDDGTDNAAVTRFLRRAYAPGATAFSVVGKLALQMENGNFTGGLGIALLDSGDAVIYYASLFSDGTTTASDSHRILGTAGTVAALTPAMWDLPFVYLLITRDASNNYVAYVGTNGIIWHRIGGSSVATTVAKVAIRWEMDTDTNHAEGLVDFVRVFDSVTRTIGADPA